VPVLAVAISVVLLLAVFGLAYVEAGGGAVRALLLAVVGLPTVAGVVAGGQNWLARSHGERYRRDVARATARRQSRGRR
jgi:uncharacterized membrane protein